MYILAIDTTTECGGAALGKDGKVIALTMTRAPLRYSQKILYLVDFLLQQQELDLDKVDCFVVATGPGSFTGLRIGLATVKALCQVLDKPAVPISTLEALAYRYSCVHSRVGAMIDARRNQVFGCIYGLDGTEPHKEGQELVLEPRRWLERVSGQDCLFVGDGAQRYQSTILDIYPQARILSTDNRILDQLLELGGARFQRGQFKAATDLTANYVRPSDAELQRSLR